MLGRLKLLEQAVTSSQSLLTSKLGVAIMIIPSLLGRYILGGFHYEQG